MRAQVGKTGQGRVYMTRYFGAHRSHVIVWVLGRKSPTELGDEGRGKKSELWLEKLLDLHGVYYHSFFDAVE